MEETITKQQIIDILADDFTTTEEKDREFHNGMIGDSWTQHAEAAAPIMFIGSSALMIVIIILLSSGNVGGTEGIFALLVYLFAHLIVVLKLTGIQPYNIKGTGETAAYFREKIRGKRECETVTGIFERGYCPPSHKLKEEIDRDLENGERPIFITVTDPLSLYFNNPMHIALFLLPCAAWVILWLFVEFSRFTITDPGPLHMIAFILLEEGLMKGTMYGLTPPLPNRITITPQGTALTLPEPFTEAVVLGGGFAFVETLMRLAVKDVNPWRNLLLRLFSTLPLHIITASLFFMGMFLIRNGTGSDRQRWMKGLSFMLLSVGVHYLYFMISDGAGWYVG